MILAEIVTFPRVLTIAFFLFVLAFFIIAAFAPAPGEKRRKQTRKDSPKPPSA